MNHFKTDSLVEASRGFYFADILYNIKCTHSSESEKADRKFESTYSKKIISWVGIQINKILNKIHHDTIF